MKLNKKMGILSLVGILATTGCFKKTVKLEKSAHKVVVGNVADIGDVTIKLWHAMGQAQQTRLNKTINDFNVLYPNITVLHESKGGYTDLESATNLAIVAGDESNIPDLVAGYPDHLATYMANDRVVTIDPYIESTDSEIGMNGAYDYEDFIPSFVKELEDVVFDGTFGLPLFKSTEILVYNKGILEECGFDIPASDAWTWDDVVLAATKVRANAKYSGSDYLPFAWDSTANAFITLGQQWGGTYTENNVGTNYPTIKSHATFKDDAKFKAGLKFYLEQVHAGLFHVPAYFAGASYSSDKFKTQNVIMTISSSAGVTYNLPAELDPELNGNFKVGVAAIPQPAATFTDNQGSYKQQVIQQGPSISMIWKGGDDHNSAAVQAYDRQRLAAWLFMRYLTNAENTASFAKNTGYNPPRLSARNNSEFNSFLNATNNLVTSYYTAQAIKASYAQVDRYYFNPAFSGSSVIRNYADTAFVNMVQAAVSGTDYDTYIDNAIAELLAAIPEAV